MDATVERIRDVLLRVADPLRIVLFGSRARGDARPESDYDFLVVVHPDASPHDLYAQIVQELQREQIDVPADVVVLRRDRYEAIRTWPSLIVHRAEAEGVVLHAAA